MNLNNEYPGEHRVHDFELLKFSARYMPSVLQLFQCHFELEVRVFVCGHKQSPNGGVDRGVLQAELLSDVGDPVSEGHRVARRDLDGLPVADHAVALALVHEGVREDSSLAHIHHIVVHVEVAAGEDL